MEVGEGGKTYFIAGFWDPAVRDLLVLNTETPKGRNLSWTSFILMLYINRKCFCMEFITVEKQAVYEEFNSTQDSNFLAWI